ncbi:MAG TPA: tyrosine/phenylalanine carboxypeptidase domain-containing protein [Acidimicrobiia bacterium]|nr:tyrosine/phenylalanine carboxypeptidase domain-containing protein [Acidimicrobiia bacterium]
MTSIQPGDLAVDRELASISGSFSFLVDLTPTNVAEAKETFLTDPSEPPRFTYRHLEDAPEVLRARVKAVDVSSVQDPTLSHLFAAKKRELELQLEMLSARETDEFLGLSAELYGSVSPSLEETATEILSSVPSTASPRGHCLAAPALARRARTEVKNYQKMAPDMGVTVDIRSDLSGVMVSNGDLLIADNVSVASSRLPGLMAHEIGTHVLTYVNGLRQPLKLLAAGLAGYEETQEGLALIAEAMMGGLTASRLRQIAARVITVRRRLAAEPFRAAHHELVESFGFSPGGAFTIVMRVYRAGGLTKDAVYLRGLQDLVGYITEGHSLASLWVGKLALIDLPLVDDLRRRGLLDDPHLLPRFLDDPTAQGRLRAIASSQGLHTLIGVEA